MILIGGFLEPFLSLWKGGKKFCKSVYFAFGHLQVLWKINDFNRGLLGTIFETLERREKILQIRISLNRSILNKSTVRVWVGGPDPRR